MSQVNLVQSEILSIEDHDVERKPLNLERPWTYANDYFIPDFDHLMTQSYALKDSQIAIYHSLI